MRTLPEKNYVKDTAHYLQEFRSSNENKLHKLTQ